MSNLYTYFTDIPFKVTHSNDLIRIFNDFKVIDFIERFKHDDHFLTASVEEFLAKAILTQGLIEEAIDILLFEGKDKSMYCVYCQDQLVFPINIEFSQAMEKAFWKGVSHYHSDDAIETESFEIATLNEITTEIINCKDSIFDVRGDDDGSFSFSYVNKNGKLRVIAAQDFDDSFKLSQYEFESVSTNPNDAKYSHLVKKCCIMCFYIESLRTGFSEFRKIIDTIKNKK